jgi:hypothetical protein
VISLTKDLKLNYHYAERAEQYSFYRMPKILFTDRRFKGLSTEAKVLYGLMLDRMGLSVKYHWFDEKNRVYIYYSLEDAMEHLGCGKDKGVKLFAELDTEKGYGLIERKKQGQGKPAIIYVKELCGNAEVLTSEKPKSALRENRSQDFDKSDPNNTNINNTDFSDTEIISYPIGGEPAENSSGDTMRWINECKSYEDLIKKNIDYDIIIERYGAWLDEIVLIMTDVVCSRSPTIRINKQDYPTDVVKSRFLKITSQHIEYIHDSIKDNTSNVRNIRAFLITTIYNSLETIDNFYTANLTADSVI